jgi:methionyl-tRNA formyltransferase
MKIALLASGGLGAKAIQQIHKCKHELVAVLTDKGSFEIQDYCKSAGIKLYTGNPRGRKCEFTSEFEIDLLLSVNYLFIIEEDLINWPKLLPVNIHGSLLPKYRGRTPHVWAIINNENETGITAHIIDSGCDTGDILLQRIVPIEANDTGAMILKKYAEEYPVLIEELLYGVENDTFKPVRQEEWRATHYGKRTPEDGAINWDWQRERIRNWIRAQALPYPGAFTYCRGQKLTIDEICLSDYGFGLAHFNGEVLSCFPDLIVKTPNGAVKIESYREKEIIINKGDVLGI